MPTLDRWSGDARALQETELIEAVMQEVTEWTSEEGLQDDMTMFVGRRR